MELVSYLYKLEKHLWRILVHSAQRQWELSLNPLEHQPQHSAFPQPVWPFEEHLQCWMDYKYLKELSNYICILIVGYTEIIHLKKLTFNNAKFANSWVS